MLDTEKYSKSIDFLLDKAGPVIQYRLRKELLHSITESEEKALLEKIYCLPLMELLKTYVKPCGYIGSGMHSWDNWRGQVLHSTPMQDGERAARLLSYYRIPRTDPLVRNFMAVLRDEKALEKEFSYIPPEVTRYANRFRGINSGNSLMAIIYVAEALMGFGDDYSDLRDFQQISLKGFRRAAEISSLEDITSFNPNLKKKYNYPVMDENEYFPDTYTLAMLAYTDSWRSEENVRMLASSFNHINEIMKPDAEMHIRVDGRCYGPAFAFIRPVRAFSPDLIDTIVYRRILTEIAMLGVGKSVGVISSSVESVKNAIDNDGILRMNFSASHNKRYSPLSIVYPDLYTDIRLEADYKDRNALLCDLTYWALEFLSYADI